MIDRSTRIFYNTKISAVDNSNLYFFDFFETTFMLNNEYVQYDQYIDYQISPTRRLNSEDSVGN